MGMGGRISPAGIEQGVQTESREPITQDPKRNSC